VYNPGPDAAMKHRKILAALLFILVLLAASYLGRGDLIRLYIANRIRRSHTFIPPPLLTTESAWSRHQDHAEFYWDFAGFILARQERVKKFEPILSPSLQRSTVVNRQGKECSIRCTSIERSGGG